MRNATIERKTNETDVKIELCLDKYEKGKIDTGCGFLNHMLELFARHASITLNIFCKGDTQVDYHHTTEDIGISLGLAFKEALQDKKGINRYGDIILPMDEALIMTAGDISGRGMLCCELSLPTQKVGDFDTELTEDFFQAFAQNLGMSLHIKQLAGRNSHHIIEGVFKSVARVVRKCVEIDQKNKDVIPSTKGTL